MATESWKAAYRELIETVVSMGYPEDFGKAIAKNLGAERAMRRMTSYLSQAKPQSAEEIADEMLSIRSDIDRWKQKKLNEEANAHYNQLRWEGLWDDNDEDADI